MTKRARAPKISVANPTLSLEALVDADLDTLVTALYVKIDDMLVKDRRPGRPVRLSQSELVCLAVAQALLGFRSEHRWIRFAICHLRGAFPYLPHQPGYNKRLRAALPLVKQVIPDLAADSDFWFDNVWIADSTPVECGRSRPTVKRSQMAGWANYGYCASHSRWFWGLRLYLICTPAGMPVLWALADPKVREREVLAAMLDVEPQLAAARPGLVLITDKGFAGRPTEADLAGRGITLLRPSRKDEAARHGEPLLKSVRQLSRRVRRFGAFRWCGPWRPFPGTGACEGVAGGGAGLRRLAGGGWQGPDGGQDAGQQVLAGGQPHEKLPAVADQPGRDSDQDPPQGGDHRLAAAGAVPLEQLAAGDEPRELVQPGGDGRGEISEAHIHAVLTCS